MDTVTFVQDKPAKADAGGTFWLAQSSRLAPEPRRERVLSKCKTNRNDRDVISELVELHLDYPSDMAMCHAVALGCAKQIDAYSFWRVGWHSVEPAFQKLIAEHPDALIDFDDSRNRSFYHVLHGLVMSQLRHYRPEIIQEGHRLAIAGYKLSRTSGPEGGRMLFANALMERGEMDLVLDLSRGDATFRMDAYYNLSGTGFLGEEHVGWLHDPFVLRPTVGWKGEPPEV